MKGTLLHHSLRDMRGCHTHTQTVTGRLAPPPSHCITTAAIISPPPGFGSTLTFSTTPKHDTRHSLRNNRHKDTSLYIAGPVLMYDPRVHHWQTQTETGLLRNCVYVTARLVGQAGYTPQPARPQEARSIRYFQKRAALAGLC